MKTLRTISRGMFCIALIAICGRVVAGQDKPKAGEDQGVGDSSRYDSFRRDQASRRVPSFDV